MGPLELSHTITFLAGRPSSGKTKAAIETCRKLLNENWNVIYYHAEGASNANPNEYGVETAEHLLQVQLITDLYFSIEELRDRISRPTEGVEPLGTLVVIDTLQLFDCCPDDLFALIETIRPNRKLHFLLLSQIPRYLERKSRDHAERYVEQAYPSIADSQVLVLGEFPDE